MKAQFTIDDAVKFILENRGNSFAFKDWSALEVCLAIKKAIDYDSLCWSINPLTQQINGICIGRVSHNIKQVHIIGIILTEPKLVRAFIRFFRQKFPSDYKLIGMRKHKTVKDFTKKLTLLERI